MDEGLEAKLILCLDLLEQGESMEQILSRYPDEAEQLRPLLNTAVKLEEFELNPSLVAQNRSKKAFLAQADALRAGSRPRRFFSIFGLRRLAMPLVALALILLLGAGLNTVSASATPGEPLYTAKRVFESLQLALTTAPVNRSDLMAQFNQERIREIQQLLDERRTADVEFEGLVRDIEPDVWIIAGLETRIDDRTEFEGVAHIGDLVAVRGRTQSGVLVAELITLLPADDQPLPIITPTTTPVASPTPTPGVEVDVPQSPSPTATNTPEPSDTPTATATVTATATPTTTDTPSPTSTSTATPSPSATSMPTSDDDGTGGENGNSNDNDDDDNENENEDHSDSGSSNENENSNETD